jgi:hypothetical protein
MRQPGEAAADTDLDLNTRPEPRPGLFVQVAPGPESPDVRDKAGAQRGMALALALGGIFWAAAGAAAVYVLRR